MIILVIIILRLLIGYVLEVGGRRFFIQAAEGHLKMEITLISWEHLIEKPGGNTIYFQNLTKETG